MNITVLSWFFYPIVWILAEGTGVLCANAEAICYTVLDIISKTVFGFLIVNHPWEVLAEALTETPGESML
jgi:bacteriorhodopsin